MNDEFDAAAKIVAEKFAAMAAERIRDITESAKSGSGTWKAAETAASITGRLAGELIRDAILARHPDGKVSYGEARAYLDAALHKNHQMISDLAADVMTGLYDKAGIHIAAQKPEYNRERMRNLARFLEHGGERIAEDLPEYLRNTSGMILEDAMETDIEREEMLPDETENFSLHTVDDAVYVNAEFADDCGIRATITRTAMSNCCAWCEDMQGEYDYEEVKAGDTECFGRHTNCRCLIEYDPGFGGMKETVNNYRRG